MNDTPDNTSQDSAPQESTSTEAVPPQVQGATEATCAVPATTLQLKVGGVYRGGLGDIVTITCPNPDRERSFIGSDGINYYENGQLMDGKPSGLDLIEVISEPEEVNTAVPATALRLKPDGVYQAHAGKLVERFNNDEDHGDLNDAVKHLAEDGMNPDIDLHRAYFKEHHSADVPPGPTYDEEDELSNVVPIRPADNSPEIMLAACRNCGSTAVHPAFITMHTPAGDRMQPGCAQCGASAPDAEAWNRIHGNADVEVERRMADAATAQQMRQIQAMINMGVGVVLVGTNTFSVTITHELLAEFNAKYEVQNHPLPEGGYRIELISREN